MLEKPDENASGSTREPEQFMGSCHCGDVQFSIISDVQELTTCDCSLCSMKNAVMLKVHESLFTLETAWEKLSVYQWNTEIAKHHFCSRCGIYTFHRKRALPDHYGINVFCLVGLDMEGLEPRKTDGACMSIECVNPKARWPGPVE